MKENNEVVIKDNINKPNKPNKPLGFKICLGLIIAILVIALLLATTFFTVLYSVSRVDETKANSIMTSATLAVMPKSIKSVDGSNLTFYVEKNDKYNPETDQTLDNFSFYYLDENGEKQYLEHGVYTTEDGEDMLVAVGFMLNTRANVEGLKNTAITILVFAIIVLVGLIIWLSYYIWAEHEEKKKAQVSKSTPIPNKRK